MTAKNQPEELASLIAKLRTAYPQMRLGQIMSNLAREYWDVFYIEDERLIARAKYVLEHGWKTE